MTGPQLRGRRRRWPGARAAVSALVLAAGCSAASQEASQEVTVFAAASLTDAFDEVATAFEAAEPAFRVALSFAGSPSLRAQILAGAPADVFAAADQADMDAAVAAGAALRPTTFATNSLQIAVPTGNPAGVGDLADFADTDLLLGLCAEQVPCGYLARQALSWAGVRPAVDTEEADVRSLLTKIQAGELDAGIVYRSDVLAADSAAEGVFIPAEANVVATYPIAVLAEASSPVGAGAFVDFVLSDQGQAILGAHGFGSP